MAIGTPVSVGAGTSTTAGTSMSASTSVTVAAGDHIVLLCAGGNGGGVLSSASGGGLTWSLGHTVTRGTVNISGIAVAHAPSGLASGTSLTINWTLSTNRQMFTAYSVSGLQTGNPLDTGNATSNATTTTPTSGTFTTTVANTIVMGTRSAIDNLTDANWTAGTGFTKCPSGTQVIGTAETQLMEYQILSSTSTLAASLTQPTIATSFAADALKAAAVVPAPPKRIVILQAINRSYTY